MHKASGRAVVRIEGSDHYLGQYGSPESHEKYEQLIAEWRVKQQERSAAKVANLQSSSANTISINEMLLRYLQFAVTYYVNRHGEQTKELQEMKYSMKPVKKLYGRTLVRDFGPLALKAIQQHMVELKTLSRKVINRRINRIRRVFKWAVSEELASGSLYEALRTVSPLKYGRTTAHETGPVKPAVQEHVDAVLEVASPQLAALIQLQQLGAMRPQEVVAMRMCDIDTSGPIWVYEYYENKNRWRDQDRLIPLGPKAQGIIKEFNDRDPQAFLFNPKEAEKWRKEQRRKNRKTPLTPSQLKRKPKRNPKRAIHDRYSVSSYCKAVKYAIAKVNRQRAITGQSEIEHWCPLMLRHSRATEIRKHYGLEAAQAALGHARADVTQVYAEKNMKLAAQIAKEIG